MKDSGQSLRRLLPLLAGALLVGMLLVAPEESQADTRREYVNKFVLLVDWVSRAELWVASHFEDPSLCRTAHSIAERHVEEARRMTPPPEFVSIHPHMLMVMENAERMFGYAAAGNRAAFRRHRRIVHEEQRIITERLQTNGNYMPVITP